MDRAIFVVGVGGTGGLLAAKIAKIIQGTDVELSLWLMDGDIVEKSNLLRQPYQSFNLNENKATSLSRKIGSNYEIKVYEFTQYLVDREITEIINQEGYDDVIICGCVDNHSTRMLLEKQYENLLNVTYVDAANGKTDGSVFITYRREGVNHGDLRSQIFMDMKDAKDHPVGICGDAIANGDTQQYVINDAMANTLAMVVNDWFYDEVKAGVIQIDGFERIFVPA